MTALYAPTLTYLCDDRDCCWNGCPSAYCQVCQKDWPCPDFIAAHTETQVKAAIRWVERKWMDGDPEAWLTRRVNEEFAHIITSPQEGT